MTSSSPRDRLDHLAQDIVAALESGAVDEHGCRALLQRLW